MKNFIIYVNPVKGFKPEIETQFKIQVENLLELGWKKEDIILATNFEWEYMGIKTHVVDDDLYFKPDPRSIKCIAIARLMERNQIFEDNTLYWCHDVDNFQQLPVTEKEITDAMGDCDMALCNYGRRVKLNCGSIFFYKSAGDIFMKMRGVVLKARKYWDTCEEERALMILTTNNLNWAYRSSVGAENSFLSARRTDTESIRKRIKVLHITYNFADYNMTSLWRMCNGQPKTAHFNPFFEKITRSTPTGCRLNFFLGENKLGIPLLNERLLKIFERHGLIHVPYTGMKNLLIYINPDGLNDNADKLIKVQIDNSLELGWKKEDIVLITNFPYEYNGVSSRVVGDECFYPTRPSSSKTYALSKLELDDHLYWLHDLDVFQLEPFTEGEITSEMQGKFMGMCDYGRRIRLNCGSIFFRKPAMDIFKRVAEVMDEYKIRDEAAIMVLTTNNKGWAYRSSVGAENSFDPAGIEDADEIKDRIRVMNFTWNFWDSNLTGCYRITKKPIRCLHMNVYYQYPDGTNKFDFWLGNNPMKMNFVPDRLKNILNKHGITGTTSNQGS